MILSGGKSRAELLLFGCLVLMSVAGGGCQGNPPRVAVCEVQGTGLVSPFLDQEVVVSGLVSADLERIKPGGFFILDDNCSQTEGGSRGLFISLEGGGDLLDLGDEIRVRGTIQEIEGETRLAAKPSGLSILSLGNSLPGPVDLSEHLASPLVFGYEDWEGQLVGIPGVDLLESMDDPTRYLVLPQLVPDPLIQLVCFQQESFVLGIKGDLLRSDLDTFQWGNGLEDLIGFIRQDQEGYFIQLIEEPIYLAEDKTPLIEEGQTVSSIGFPVVAPPSPATPSLTPSMTPEPDYSPTSTSSPTRIPSPTYYPVRLQLTEVLPNPQGEEPGGEWIEIYNPLGGRLPLDGIKIGDEVSPAGNEGMLRFPDGFYIDQGQVLVIANQALIFKSLYGFLPDFELVDSDPRVPNLVPYHRWGRNSINLSNTGDEVLLVDPWDTIVDMLSYGKSVAGGSSVPVAAPAEGDSLTRYSQTGEQDQLGEWQDSSSPSPGTLSHPPPTTTASQTVSPTPVETSSLTPASSSETPGLPAITPFSTDSSSTPDTPPGSKTPGISVTPTPWPTPTGTPSLTPLALPSGTYLPALTLPATPSLTQPFSGTPSSTSSLTPQVTFTPAVSITISPTLEPLPTTTSSQASLTPTPSGTYTQTLTLPAGTPSSTSSLTPQVTFTPAVSITISPTLEPLPTATSPQASLTTTPSGTVPPAQTPTKTPEPGLVINEILADPDPTQGDSNRDGVINSDDDEFLELVNISEQALDLSGWMVFDGVRLRFTLPEGTILGSGCGLVLFGGGQPSGDFGGSLVFTAGSLGLNNKGDVITLRDPDGIEMAEVSYGPEGNQDQSLTRNPDLFGPLPLVTHSQLPQAGGKLYSPGTRIDGSAFSRCP